MEGKRHRASPGGSGQPQVGAGQAGRGLPAPQPGEPVPGERPVLGWARGRRCPGWAGRAGHCPPGHRHPWTPTPTGIHQHRHHRAPPGHRHRPRAPAPPGRPWPRPGAARPAREGRPAPGGADLGVLARRPGQVAAPPGRGRPTAALVVPRDRDGARPGAAARLHVGRSAAPSSREDSPPPLAGAAGRAGAAPPPCWEWHLRQRRCLRWVRCGSARRCRRSAVAAASRPALPAPGGRGRRDTRWSGGLRPRAAILGAARPWARPCWVWHFRPRALGAAMLRVAGTGRAQIEGAEQRNPQGRGWGGSDPKKGGPGGVEGTWTPTDEPDRV